MSGTLAAVVHTPARAWAPYPEYKDSGVEWLGKLPAHWQLKRLRFACRINPPKSELTHLPINTVVSFLPMELIGEDGSLTLDETRAIEQVQQGYTYFRNDDVIVAKITPCFENGKGALCHNLVNSIGFGTTELHVLRAGEGILPTFLFYLTRSQPFLAVGTGAMYGAGGQKRVPEDFFTNFRMGLPPLAEQRAIAAFLDCETAQLDALAAKKERLIALLGEKRAALISHAVTKGLDPHAPMKDSGVEWLGEIPAHWEAIAIKRLCLVKRGASPRPIDDPAYFDDEGEYAWVRIADVSASGRYLTQTTQRLSLLGQSASVKMQPGDLIVSIAGTVGKPIITEVKCCIHDGFVYFAGLRMNTEFLYYIFAASAPSRSD